ncbi:MAG: TlpA family protein disulfide reductase [Bacteroidia bacterium]
MRLKTLSFFVFLCLLISFELCAQDNGISEFGKITSHLQKNFPEVDFSDKLILVSFWSAENAQSRMNNRDMLEVWNIYKAALLKNGKKGVVFYTISTDKNKMEWELACKKDNLEKVPNYCDLQGMDSEIIKALNVMQIPHNVLFDSNGKVIAVDMKTRDVVFNTFLNQITRQ